MQLPITCIHMSHVHLNKSQPPRPWCSAFLFDRLRAADRSHPRLGAEHSATVHAKSTANVTGFLDDRIV